MSTFIVLLSCILVNNFAKGALMVCKQHIYGANVRIVHGSNILLQRFGILGNIIYYLVRNIDCEIYVIGFGTVPANHNLPCWRIRSFIYVNQTLFSVLS